MPMCPDLQAHTVARHLGNLVTGFAGVNWPSWEGVGLRATLSPTSAGRKMSANRVFFPQQALDAWLEQGRIALVGDELTISPEGRRFSLTAAVRFMAEVAENNDSRGLVGKIKTLEQLHELAGEHDMGSVIIGDNAYEVIDGFLGEPAPMLAKGGPRRSLANAKAPQPPDPNDPLTALLQQM